VRIVLSILNDAWSDNWGFVPFTEAEISYAAKKLKPIIHPSINRIAELDGKPVAFMLTLPDVNGVLQDIDGKLLPFGWIKMLRWLRKPMGYGMRVPLMGVVRELHNSRLASQLAFMMITEIRVAALENYGSKRAEMGWILDDNQGMVAIADAIGSKVNREYTIYGKDLDLPAWGKALRAIARRSGLLGRIKNSFDQNIGLASAPGRRPQQLQKKGLQILRIESEGPWDRITTVWTGGGSRRWYKKNARAGKRFPISEP